jgi:hypothetical protein
MNATAPSIKIAAARVLPNERDHLPHDRQRAIQASQPARRYQNAANPALRR